jgi:trehalose/maltose transport system substrate-binding protein
VSRANGRHGGPVNGKPLPNPVTQLMAESLAGQISRREMLRRAAALGLSAPLVALMLSAQSRAARAQETTPPPDPNVGSTIVVPEGLRTDLQGAQIAAVLSDTTDPNGPWVQAAIDKFTEATGIAVNFVRGETQADQRLQAYRQQFAGQSGDFDVFQIDVIWPGIVAEHAVDLTESLGEITGQFFQPIVENNTVDGKLVGIPWFTDAGLFYYRTDLLEKYQLQPPTTWDELQTAAQTIQDGERADNPAFTGFVWQGRAYEGLTCNGLEWQFSNGGGTIIDEDGTVTVNNPQAIEAFERARGWVGSISPQDVTTFRETETLNVWTAGNAAFARNWPYMWASSQDAPVIAGKVGVSPLPRGTGENASSAATLGGWQLMVSQYSQNQEPAIEFVRYLTSPELQTSFAIERSMLPTIGAVYDSPDVAAASEFIPRLREVFEGGAVARPSSVSADLYGDVSRIYYVTLNEILAGSTSAEDGAADMEEELSAIMEELGY